MDWQMNTSVSGVVVCVHNTNRSTYSGCQTCMLNSTKKIGGRKRNELKSNVWSSLQPFGRECFCWTKNLFSDENFAIYFFKKKNLFLNLFFVSFFISINFYMLQASQPNTKLRHLLNIIFISITIEYWTNAECLKWNVIGKIICSLSFFFFFSVLSFCLCAWVSVWTIYSHHHHNKNGQMTFYSSLVDSTLSKIFPLKNCVVFSYKSFSCKKSPDEPEKNYLRLSGKPIRRKRLKIHRHRQNFEAVYKI